MLVASVSKGNGTSYVTFNVYARCRESVMERPVPLRLEITLPKGGESDRALQDWLKYGRPFTSPEGSTNAWMDLPGGLGGDFAAGSVSLTAQHLVDHEPYDLRLQVVDADTTLLAEAVVHMQPAVMGLDKTGVYGLGQEQHGVFDLQLLTDLESSNVRMLITRPPMNGRPPRNLTAGLRFLAGLHHPNGLRIAAAVGPVSAPPLRFAETVISRPEHDDMVELVVALNAIQQHITHPLVVPESIKSYADIAELTRMAEVMSGATYAYPWPGDTEHLPHDAVLDAEPFKSLIKYVPISIELDEVSIPLGYIEVSVAKTAVTYTPHENHMDAQYAPCDEPPAVCRFVAEPPEFAPDSPRQPPGTSAPDSAS